MKLRRPQHLRRYAAAGAVVALAAAAVITVNWTNSHSVGPISQSLAAGSGSDAVWLAQNLRENMPNQRFQRPDGTAIVGSESVVLGTITDVRLGNSYTVEGDSIVPAKADSAMWSMATATVKVEQAWGKLAGAKTTQVVLPLRGSDSVDTQLTSARSLGRVVLFLTNGRIDRNDLLIAQVHEDGKLAFPVVDAAAKQGEYPVDPTTFFAGIDSVDALKKALGEPVRTIKIDQNTNRLP